MVLPETRSTGPYSPGRRMRIYGLTGAMGSGKTEAARFFAELGAPVIHADTVGHEIIAPGGEGEEAVAAAFGGGILTDGKIDRAKLGALVFSDEPARRRLNAIVHPLIQKEISRRCAVLEEQAHAFVLIDAALIAEDGVKSTFLDGLIVVDCPLETRLRRLADARGVSREDALRRMAAQAPPEWKLAIADWVLDNSGAPSALQAQVRSLVEELRQHVR